MNKFAAIGIAVCAAVVTVAFLMGAHPYAWQVITWAWVAAWYATRLWRATR